MKILVTGGAGYIGSHMTRMLVGSGHEVVVVDSLERGSRAALPRNAFLVKGNIKDRKALEEALNKISAEAVIHFAGYISMAESVQDPRKYLTNNLIVPVTLLETMLDWGVKYLIFSSTAGVYGNPHKIPIPENHPKTPLSPYGLSKLAFEQLLNFYTQEKGLRAISLRYFNAAGASFDGNYGENHDPETHIIPLAMRVALGLAKEFYLYGDDYLTRDGSCIRDYIHIEDLCQSHLLSLDALVNGHSSDVYNVGTGYGVTNKEVISAVKKASGVDFPVVIKQRRAGDASQLVADSGKLKKEFGWEPKHSEIKEIVATAWKWHQSHPNGYIT